MHPPNTTEETVPIRAAAVPDSNSPISFDEPMKIELTEAIRPRIDSGEFSCRIAFLTTMLTASNPPLKASAANESQNHLEAPKTIMQTPYPKTDARNTGPA